MLPDDWKKQIEDAAHEANRSANEQNRHLYENLSARLDTVGDQIRRYNDTEDRERPKNQRREIGTIRALVAAAIGTGALAIFTAWQAYETHEAFGPIQKSANAADKQVTAMQGQLDEMKRQSIANERASTAGRAYLFASMKIPNRTDMGILNPNYFAITIAFWLENFGQTPAVIDKFETHVLVGRQRQITGNPPMPNSAEFRAFQEDHRQPATSANPAIDIIFDDSFQSPVVIPATSGSIPFKQSFFFSRPAVYPPDRPLPEIPVTTMGTWFYCSVTYKDIFNFDRHTVYYVGQFGASITLPKDPGYNHWD